MLDAFFEPASIAVVGASRFSDKIGHVILKNLVDGGFRGKLYPVNPHAQKILHLDCYSSLTAIKSSIDLVIIAVPSSLVLQILKDCVRKRCKAVVMITAGFREVGNHQLEDEVHAYIKKNHIRMIGPNCLGIVNTPAHLDMLFLPRVRLRRPEQGGISFICQSGALGSALIDIMAKEGIGLSKFISYGNALDISESDLLEALGQDSTTKVICLYIEGLKDGKRFMDVAAKVTQKKPVIVIKGGLSTFGAKAVLSHTASLAGSGEIFFSACRQAGILPVASLEDMHDLAHLFEKTPLPHGKRIQVITNGGGYGILCADAIAKYNLMLAEMLSTTQKHIKKGCAAEAIIHNPIDLTGGATSDQYKRAIEACVEDPQIDVILLVLLMQTPLVSLDILPFLEHIKQKHRKPIVILMPGGHFVEIHKHYLERVGFSIFDYPENAMKAIAALCTYVEQRRV